jgi:hypothetical protein
MSESIFVASQIYLYAFVISLGIAGLIKLMLWTIHRFSPKTAEPGAEASNE